MSAQGSRLLAIAPMGIVLALYGWVGETLLVPLSLFIVAVCCALVGPRLPVDRATQRVFSIVVAVLGVAIARASLDPDQGLLLHAFWVGILAAVTVIVSFRSLCKVPDGGLRATIALEFIALLAVGETRIGPLYAMAIVSFLALALAALRADDPARPSVATTSGRARRIGIAMVAATLPIAVLLAAPTRPLANYVHRKIEAVFERAYENRVSTFSDGMRVGKLSRMLRSNTVALRIYGPKPELLRTVVFDNYESGMFSHATAPSADALVETRRGPLSGERVTYVMRGSRETDRFFLPAGATELVTAAGQVRTESFGIFRGVPNAATKRYWFRAPELMNGGSANGTMTEPGTASDLQLPEGIRTHLLSLADQWTLGAHGDEAVLDSIEQHLRTEFTYALDHDHSKGSDPVLHFLFRDRAGHCEYFAAAMTLLARAKGIPARYVSGYRVTERNPLDGHYVVREKNAHSWVEAWAVAEGGSGQWRTFDPTPMAESFGGAPEDEAAGDATLDLFASWWERAEAWLIDRTLTELTLAAIVGTMIFAGIRWWRGRKLREAEDAIEEAPFAEPLPFLADLLDALSGVGFRRLRSMPLERFARELPDETSRTLILRYASHRYGQREDPALAAAMAAHARTLRARGSAPLPASTSRNA